jgi:hypothetical protein
MVQTDNVKPLAAFFIKTRRTTFARIVEVRAEAKNKLYVLCM